MRLACLILLGVLGCSAADVSETLKAKRELLKSFHQEFNVSVTYRYPHVEPATAFFKESVDAANHLWREGWLTGSTHYWRIFDGQQVSEFEEGSDEYTVPKGNGWKPDQMLPDPYGLKELDWSKAVEVKRETCAIPEVKHACVWYELPVKAMMGLGKRRSDWRSWTQPSPIVTILGGQARAQVDLDTGLMVWLRVVESQESRNGVTPAFRSYQIDTTFALQKLSFGMPSTGKLYELPPNHSKKVEVLTEWDADKVNRELAGRPAPDLALTDLAGKPLVLASLKGKVVLLDYWATWCEPCREDAPELDKLADRFEKQLVVIGVSVDEERSAVEGYLAKHPHGFTTVLGSENDLSRAYRFSGLPTYLVIGKDGEVVGAVLGSGHLPTLRTLLNRGGLGSSLP